MNREELIDMIIDHSAGATDNVADGVCFKTLADSILKCLSLPPAEGAEEILRKNCNTCYSRSTGEEEVWSSVSSVLIAMQDFATLHAQRIADKMVEERNNTNYDMKPIEVTMDYAIKKLKKLIRVQRTCPQGHGKMKKTSFGPYWCLNCQKYYE